MQMNLAGDRKDGSGALQASQPHSRRDRRQRLELLEAWPPGLPPPAQEAWHRSRRCHPSRSQQKPFLEVEKASFQRISFL